MASSIRDGLHRHAALGVQRPPWPDHNGVFQQRRAHLLNDISREKYRSEGERVAAEKRHYDQAMEDAVRRGLRVDEDRPVSKKPLKARRAGSGSWRSKPDFIRVLLKETRMSVSEIASTAGVSVNEVFKEKLLMRQASGT